MHLRGVRRTVAKPTDTLTFHACPVGAAAAAAAAVAVVAVAVATTARRVSRMPYQKKKRCITTTRAAC